MQLQDSDHSNHSLNQQDSIPRDQSDLSEQQSFQSSENSSEINQSIYHTEYGDKKQRETQIKEYKRKINDKNNCSKFIPEIEYYLGASSQIIQKNGKTLPKFLYLQRPKISFNPFENMPQYQSLSVSKQIQHLRGTVKDHIDHNFIKQILQNEKQTTQPIMRQGHKSLLTQDKLQLIYAYQNIVKIHGKFSNNFLDSYKSTKTNNLLKLPQKILELRQVTEELICIRTKNALFLYYLTENKHQLLDYFTILSFKGITNQNIDYQITCLQIQNKTAHQICIKIGVYYLKEHKCYIYNWIINIKKIKKMIAQIQQPKLFPINQQVLQNIQNRFTTKKLLIKISQTSYLISINSVNQRQIVLGFYNKIGLLDLKTNAIEQIYTTSSAIYAVNLIRGRYYDSSYILISQKRYFRLYNMYNNQFQKIMPHHCQISPPSILITENFPLVIAYSTQKRGNGLLLDFKKEQKYNDVFKILGKSETLRSEYFEKICFNNKLCKNYDSLEATNNPLSLFNSGILNTCLHPISYNCLVIQNKLFIIQVDSQQGISVQSFQRNINTTKLQHHSYENLENNIDLEQQLIRDQIYSIYFQKHQNPSKQDQQNEDSEIISSSKQKNENIFAKFNYLTLTKFENTINQKVQNPSELNHSATLAQTLPHTLEDAYESLPNENNSHSIFKNRNNKKIITSEFLEQLDKNWQQL